MQKQTDMPLERREPGSAEETGGKRLARRASGIFRAAVFLLLLAALVVAASVIVERKNSRVQYGAFFDNPEAYDVLFFGDSQLVNVVFPTELYRSYGISAYNMACIGSTIPVSYWTMMNALDYASPKLVVIGVKDVEKSYKLSGSSGDVHTAMDVFPISRTKLRAIWDLMDDPYAQDDEGNFYSEMKWEYIFTIGKYHSRWSELSTDDFRLRKDRYKGGRLGIGVAQPMDYDILDEWETLEEDGSGFEYLRRMIEECQTRGIDVLLTQIPYPADELSQRAANTVSCLAEEYGVDFIDFVALDQVVDYATDCMDRNSHLNPSGAQKVTDYLGRYIAEHYDIPDRRADALWEEDALAFDAHKLSTLSHQTSLDRALMLLHDPSMSAVVHIAPGAGLEEDEMLERLMQNIAREHIFEEDAYAKWSDSLFPLDQLGDAAEGYLLVVDRQGGRMRRGDRDRVRHDSLSAAGRGGEPFAPARGRGDRLPGRGGQHPSPRPERRGRDPAAL